MVNDCLFHRVPIGRGEIPNLEIMKILKEAGHVESVGPEIFSEDLDRLDGNGITAEIMPGFEDILDQLETRDS